MSYNLNIGIFSEGSVSAVGQRVLNRIMKYNSVYMACVKHVPQFL